MHTDKKIKRPEKGTKIYKRPSGNYVYYTTGSEYKKDKQYVVEKRMSIGKMIDDEFMHPNDNYYLYYPRENDNEDNTEELSDESQVRSDALHVGTVSLLNKIMADLGLSDILDEVYGSVSTQIKDIVNYMIIEETSTMQHYQNYVWNHKINSKSVWSDTQISDLFKKRIKRNDAEKLLFNWNQLQSEKDDIYISYDSTNMNTKAEGIEMAEFGYAKEDSSVPQVNLSYVVNQSNARPLFYEMYPGSIIDNSQCSYMVDKAKEYGYKGVGFILDRGYFSMSNLRYFDKNDYNFIMMVKQNSQTIQEYVNKVMYSLKNDLDCYLSSYGIYAKTLEGSLWKDDKRKRYIHVYYDNMRANEEKNRYLDQLEKKEESLKKKVAEKIIKEEELLSYKHHFKLEFDDYGYLLDYKRINNKIKNDVDKLGHFVLVTSKKMEASEALNKYRSRDSTEKLFRALKTGLECDTFRVHSQESLEGKMQVTFIASIVRNELFQKLKEIKGKDKKNFTVPAVIRELEKVIAVKDNNGKYKRRYSLNAKQKKILSAFDIDEQYLNNQVRKIK
jgi:transposase